MKRPGLTSFNGFPGGKVRFTAVPAPFFADLLPEIDNLAELKVILYALWFLDRQETTIRFLRHEDFTADERFMQGLGSASEEALRTLNEGLECAVQRNVLLLTHSSDGRSLYFLNTPRGRAAISALQNGAWRPEDAVHPEATLTTERPNIYLLYEQNIGPLTPMIADTLRDAEQTYPPDWIEEALRTAVQKNIRNWRYVEAILRAWKERGRNNEEDRRNSQTNYRKYREDEYADFIEH